MFTDSADSDRLSPNLEFIPNSPPLSDFPLNFCALMVSFTKQERLVLLGLAFVLLSGSIFQYLLKRYPRLKDSVFLLENDRVGPKVDLNTASLEDLVRLPYIGEYTARNILAYRAEKGRFASVEEVKFVKGIKEKNYQRFSRYLMVRKPKG